jgi:hypothetical protein
MIAQPKFRQADGQANGFPLKKVFFATLATLRELGFVRLFFNKYNLFKFPVYSAPKIRCDCPVERIDRDPLLMAQESLIGLILRKNRSPQQLSWP